MDCFINVAKWKAFASEKVYWEEFILEDKKSFGEFIAQKGKRQD
ncbi:MAG: hypothetical protein ACYDG2_01080 [Ruminiclostridium sp.]